MHIVSHEEHVDNVKPGDRVEVTGVYRAQGVRVNSAKRTLNNIYRTFIDVVNFVKSDTRRYALADEGAKNAEEEVAALDSEHKTFSPEQIEKMKRFG